MSTPTVSVIIPAYNAAAFIHSAIESALAQTCAPLEILVVDDGSRDETAEVVARYPAPVRLLRKENGGPASARNLAAREAQGEWLALLDADDSWHPEKLARQLPYGDDPKIGVVHCSTRALEDPITFERLWKRNCIVNSTVLIRRSAFRAIGGFDEDRAVIGVEDYNLWLRLTAAGWTVATCPEQLFSYTPTPGSLTNQVERFANAELANAERIVTLLGLTQAQLRAKRAAICEEYGRVLLWKRQMVPARRYLLQGLREFPTLSRVAWWMAASLPPQILNSYRELRYTR